MAALRLLMLLSPVCCLPEAEQDAKPPITNVRMDPDRGRLTWDLNTEASDISCTKDSDQIQWVSRVLFPLHLVRAQQRLEVKPKSSSKTSTFYAVLPAVEAGDKSLISTEAVIVEATTLYQAPKLEAEEDAYCEYETLSLCRVTNYTVTVERPPFATWILFPERDAQPAAAAADLDCWVHDVELMSCRWGVGSAAPGDVQYRLYWKDQRSYRECVSYERDAQGRHVGCRFHDIARFPRTFVVMVNGSSQLSPVSCTDFFADLPLIEKLSPPNLTAKCNESQSLMRWKMFSHFTKDFHYELQINKSERTSITESVSTNFFLLRNPGNYEATIRVQYGGDAYSQWSPWGAARSFRCDPREDLPSPVLWTALLVAAGTLAVALAGLIVCKRFSLMRKLFPRIPHVRAPVCDSTVHDAELVEADREDCPVAEVQVLEK